jgi:CHAD domain-containing protein
VTTSLEFIIPAGSGVDTLLNDLKSVTRHLAETPRTVQRTCYDSFDWRLYAERSVLEVTRNGSTHTLLWRTLDGRQRCPRLTLQQPPRFIHDLPPGRLRELLEPVLEMRELLPQVKLRSRVHALRILNRDDKTVAWLSVEENTLPRQGGTRAGQLEDRVILTPVRGYPKAGKRIVRLLEQHGLSRAADDLALVALSALGVTPGSYSSKLDLDLDPAMRADQATKRILQRLLDIMQQNEAGTRTGSDTEFLHDFRVAIRRTRSALTQIKGVFPKRIVERYKNEFAWLGQITSPSRDLDVYLLNFAEYRASLPADMQADLDPLHEFLRRHQGIEHRALVKALDSARYRRLLCGWQKFLEQAVPVRSTLPHARQPVAGVADRRIWRIYRRAIREGDAIDARSPAADLHELRKTCKKLRYLMEFFQSLYPADRIKELIRVLKTLQDNLGNFQDYEVQVMTLKEFSHRMTAEGNVSPDTLLAMGMLIDGLERRQHEAREEFAGRFAEFSRPENQERFSRLFAPRH